VRGSAYGLALRTISRPPRSPFSRTNTALPACESLGVPQNVLVDRVGDEDSELEGHFFLLHSYSNQCRIVGSLGSFALVVSRVGTSL
jgi:hypothetical protein